MGEDNKYNPPKMVILTSEEITRLVICVMLDLVEFAFPILLSPFVGDILDVLGFGVGILMFGWIGCLAIFELVPFADYFPIFFIMWVIWYYRKKRKERVELDDLQKKWM